jgi:hypothetical protein
MSSIAAFFGKRRFNYTDVAFISGAFWAHEAAGLGWALFVGAVGLILSFICEAQAAKDAGDA